MKKDSYKIALVTEIGIIIVLMVCIALASKWVVGRLDNQKRSISSISRKSSESSAQQESAQDFPAEIGFASYYDEEFHNQTTASGELYDKNKLTAAHRTYPFGTRIRVTNLKNNKSVIVRINDRGPLKKGRIIDLSERAAGQIGLIKKGVAKVKVEVMK